MTFLGKDFNLDRIDGAYITVADKKFTRLKRSDIENILMRAKRITRNIRYAL